MLKLGILGGMGPKATYECFKMVVDKTNASCDQQHLDIIIANHASLPDRTEAIKTGNTREVTDMLCSDAAFLEQSGADIIIMPCNTAHMFLDEIQKAIKIKIINMVKEAVNEAVRLKKKKVAILATEGTILSGIYSDACKAAGIEAYAPDRETQKYVTRILYDQIKKGLCGDAEDFDKISSAIKAAGCDGAILACTEFSVYKKYHKEQVDSFYIDAMEILAEKAILLCGAKVN